MLLDASKNSVEIHISRSDSHEVGFIHVGNSKMF